MPEESGLWASDDMECGVCGHRWGCIHPCVEKLECPVCGKMNVSNYAKDRDKWLRRVEKEVQTHQKPVCLVCRNIGSKALVGIFPIKICTDYTCACAWGFWASMAFWLSDHLTPNNGGWWVMLYHGGYLRAVWAMLRGENAT